MTPSLAGRQTYAAGTCDTNQIRAANKQLIQKGAPRLTQFDTAHVSRKSMR